MSNPPHPWSTAHLDWLGEPPQLFELAARRAGLHGKEGAGWPAVRRPGAQL